MLTCVETRGTMEVLDEFTHAGDRQRATTEYLYGLLSIFSSTLRDVGLQKTNRTGELIGLLSVVHLCLSGVSRTSNTIETKTIYVAHLVGDRLQPILACLHAGYHHCEFRSDDSKACEGSAKHNALGCPSERPPSQRGFNVHNRFNVLEALFNDQTLR